MGNQPSQYRITILRMTPSPGRDTRSRIVGAARELFYARGYEATSLKEVARAADAHGGSLHHFFPKKSDLVEAVLEEYLELLDPVIMTPARTAGRDPVGQVMEVMRFYRRRLIDSNFSDGCPIGGLALELGGRFPGASELIQRNFEAWRDSVADMLEGADWPDNIDVQGLASFVLTTMEGAVMLARGHRSITPFDDAVEQLRRHLLNSASAGRAL